jgi:5-methylcytosine-specific restriction endonuclease McrA
VAERWQQWMPSRLWPTRREIAEDEALQQCLHDLYNSYYDPEVLVVLAGRIRGWRWEQIRRRIFGRDNHTCRYCGVVGGRLECDHVIPVSRGGTNEDDNLATACFPCNRSKRARLISEWVGANG